MQGTQIDSDVAGRIRQMDRDGVSARSTAKQLKLSEATVHKYRRAGRADSLKARLLKTIVQRGPFSTLRALTEAVRQPNDNFDQHEVTHLLFRLNKDGCVKFVERSNNGLEHIAATAQGVGAAFRVQPQVASTVAEAPAPIVEEAVAVQEWPQLQQLRIRLAELKGMAVKAAAYYDAATALESVDPEESERLLRRAEEVGGTPLSAVEAEYLRFADRA